MPVAACGLAGKMFDCKNDKDHLKLKLGMCSDSMHVFKINLKLYVYFCILYNFIFGDILLSRSQIFIDGCNPKDNIEKYVKNNIDNLSKMVPSYCSCLHKRNYFLIYESLRTLDCFEENSTIHKQTRPVSIGQKIYETKFVICCWIW